MVNYACAFSQSELGKYFERIIIIIISHLFPFQGWSRKWNDLVNKGPEYGTVKSSWLNITSEADKLAEIHNELQIRLVNQVHGNVQKWKSANYHKSLLSWKETKTAEEGFSKAQKPWAKRQDEGNNNNNDNEEDDNNNNNNNNNNNTYPHCHSCASGSDPNESPC